MLSRSLSCTHGTSISHWLGEAEFQGGGRTMSPWAWGHCHGEVGDRSPWARLRKPGQWLHQLGRWGPRPFLPCPHLRTISGGPASGLPGLRHQASLCFGPGPRGNRLVGAPTRHRQFGRVLGRSWTPRVHFKCKQWRTRIVWRKKKPNTNLSLIRKASWEREWEEQGVGESEDRGAETDRQAGRHWLPRWGPHPGRGHRAWVAGRSPGPQRKKRAQEFHGGLRDSQSTRQGPHFSQAAR